MYKKIFKTAVLVIITLGVNAQEITRELSKITEAIKGKNPIAINLTIEYTFDILNEELIKEELTIEAISSQNYSYMNTGDLQVINENGLSLEVSAENRLMILYKTGNDDRLTSYFHKIEDGLNQQKLNASIEDGEDGFKIVRISDRTGETSVMEIVYDPINFRPQFYQEYGLNVHPVTISGVISRIRVYYNNYHEVNIAALPPSKRLSYYVVKTDSGFLPAQNFQGFELVVMDEYTGGNQTLINSQ